MLNRKQKGAARCAPLTAALLGLTILAGSGLVAQGPGGGHPGVPGGMGGMGGPGGMGRPGRGFPGEIQPRDMPGNSPAPGSTRNPLQHGPVGRWWDNNKYAHSVGLTSDQQRRMDSVFADNRAALVNGLDALRKAEARLGAVSSMDRPSEGDLNAEIQNVAQARADLEKANAHMVLQIRNEMTAEQLSRMDKLK